MVSEDLRKARLDRARSFTNWMLKQPRLEFASTTAQSDELDSLKKKSSDIDAVISHPHFQRALFGGRVWISASPLPRTRIYESMCPWIALICSA
jgi:hypothetical protein